MRPGTRNYWMFIVQAVLSLLLGVSSFLLWVVFPRGYFPARTLWVAIHKWSGLALGVAVSVHVLLHRAWLVRMTRRHLVHLQTTCCQSIERLSDLAQRRRPGGTVGNSGYLV